MSVKEDPCNTDVPRTPPLEAIALMDKDELLDQMQKIRMRQVLYDFEKNGGALPPDPEEARIVLANMKDLESQILKRQQIGAKQSSNAAEALAAAAVLRALQLGGKNQRRREPGEVYEGEVRSRPNVKDVAGLPKLEKVPGEDAVEISNINIDDVLSGRLEEGAAEE
jgi:hypothetical protein